MFLNICFTIYACAFVSLEVVEGRPLRPFRLKESLYPISVAKHPEESESGSKMGSGHINKSSPFYSTMSICEDKMGALHRLTISM